MNNFTLPLDWKQKATYLTKGGRRNIYILGNYVIKENYSTKTRHKKKDNLEIEFYNQIIQKISPQFHENFCKIYYKKDNITVQELIKNYDNTISKNFEQIQNPKIKIDVLNQFERLIEKLIEQEIFFFDIIPKNIIVKEISKNKFIPIIFDYKNINRTYALQPSTYTKTGKINKIIKRLNKLRLENSYKNYI